MATPIFTEVLDTHATLLYKGQTFVAFPAQSGGTLSQTSSLTQWVAAEQYKTTTTPALLRQSFTVPASGGTLTGNIFRTLGSLIVLESTVNINFDTIVVARDLPNPASVPSLAVAYPVGNTIQLDNPGSLTTGSKVVCRHISGTIPGGLTNGTAYILTGTNPYSLTTLGGSAVDITSEGVSPVTHFLPASGFGETVSIGSFTTTLAPGSSISYNIYFEVGSV